MLHLLVNAVDVVYQSSDQRQQPRWVVWLMVGLILVGAMLRWSTLDAQPLWLDEFVTLRMATDQDGISGIWASVARRIHPPLHLLMTRSLLAFLPTDEFTMRWLSAASGTLALAILARYLLDAVGPIPAVLGTSLLTVSPFHLHYSQEARAYAFSMTVLVFAALLFRRQLARGDLCGWLVHGFCLVVLAYTHYFNLFIIGAEALYVAALILWRRPSRQVWGGFLISMLLVGTSLLPLIAPFLQAFQVQRILNWTASRMSPISALKTLATGEHRYVSSICRSVGGGALIGLAGVGLTLSTRGLLFDLLAFGFPFLFIFVLLSVLGHTVPIYEERQLLVVLPFAIALASAGIETFWRRRATWSRALALVAVAVVLVASLGGVYQYNNDYLKNQDFALVEYLREAAQPGDLVLLNTYSAEATFDFYGEDHLTYWGKPKLEETGWTFSTEIGLAFGDEVPRDATWQDLMARSTLWLIYLPGQGPAALTDELLEQRSVLKHREVGPFHVYLLGQDHKQSNRLSTCLSPRHSRSQNRKGPGAVHLGQLDGLCVNRFPRERNPNSS